MVSPAQSESGFYSRYFLVPKKDGGLFAEYERHLLSLPDSSPPQAILEIRLRESSLSTHGPPLWAVPGSPHF